MIKNISRPNLDNLQVGDTVYSLRCVNMGFTVFRYRIISKEKILRITPKRTKIITDKAEYVNCDNRNPFIIPDEKLLKEHNIAQSFIKVCNARTEFSKQNLKEYSDEEILQLSEISEQLRNIFKKHNND